MAKVYDSILDLVGKTPLVELKRIEEKEGLQAKLIAKVESFNPAGSVKDRIAKAMIEDAPLSLSRPPEIPESDWQRQQR